jgi:hypothetical protein
VRIWDQSPQGNHLDLAPFNKHKVQPGNDNGVNASSFPITLSGGWRAYGAYFTPGCGYRNYKNTTGVAVANAPEVIYFVIDGTRSNDKCCFDFGSESRAWERGRGPGARRGPGGEAGARERGGGPGDYLRRLLVLRALLHTRARASAACVCTCTHYCRGACCTTTVT